MIFLTGDLHGKNDFDKIFRFNSFVNKKKKIYNEQIFLIILGDFGLNFFNEGTELDKRLQLYINVLSNCKFTTLFVDGNHENFPRLNKLKTKIKYGSKVGKLAKNIYHLKRGNIYNIDKTKFYVMGGASSIDKNLRTPFYDWWPEEEENYMQFNNHFKYFKKHKDNIHYILSHQAPLNVLNKLYYKIKYDNTSLFLDEIQKLSGKQIFCGHLHMNEFVNNTHILYNNIISFNTLNYIITE